MKNLALQQSLVELEENLKNLESARTQVEKVSNKSEQLTLAFTKILSQIELLQNEFNKEQGFFKEIIGKSISEFNSALDIKSKEFILSSNSLNKNLSSSITTAIEKLTVFQQTIDKTIQNVNNIDFEKNFTLLQKQINEINISFQDIKKENLENRQILINQIEILNKTQKKQSLITLAVIIIGFIFVLTLLFVVK